LIEIRDGKDSSFEGLKMSVLFNAMLRVSASAENGAEPDKRAVQANEGAKSCKTTP